MLNKSCVAGEDLKMGDVVFQGLDLRYYRVTNFKDAEYKSTGICPKDTLENRVFRLVKHDNKNN